MSPSEGERAGSGRFRAVVAVGLVCAALLGGVVFGLTGSVGLGAAVAVVVAVVLVGLGVVGVRQGEAQPAAMAAHEARQRRLRQVLEAEVLEADERRDESSGDPPPRRPGDGPGHR